MSQPVGIKTRGIGHSTKDHLNLTRSLETVEPFGAVIIRPRRAPIQRLTSEERSRRISEGMRDGRLSRMGAR